MLLLIVASVSINTCKTNCCYVGLSWLDRLDNFSFKLWRFFFLVRDFLSIYYFQSFLFLFLLGWNYLLVYNLFFRLPRNRLLYFETKVILCWEPGFFLLRDRLFVFEEMVSAFWGLSYQIFYVFACFSLLYIFGNKKISISLRVHYIIYIGNGYKENKQ